MMKKNMMLILCFVLSLTCAGNTDRISVPLEIVGNKTHVTVRIGDTEIPHILLDTGFAFDGLMIYNPDYQDSLTLTGAVPVRIGGAGSGEAATALMLDSASFFLGDIPMTRQRIIMLQGDHYKGFPSNGIIGYSIFGHYITELDYDQERMVLHTADSLQVDHTWAEIPLTFKDNQIPWLDASVVIDDEAPIPLSMYIDYASGQSVELLEKPDMKFSLPEKTENIHLGRGLSGDIYGRTGVISRLIIGPYELKDIEAAFAPAEVRSRQTGADGILGVGSLRRFNLIFDYGNRKLFIKPNRHFLENSGGL